MSERSKFWDKMAERYAKKPVADEAAYQKKLKITRDYFRPDMEVLEFGCGTGSTAIAQAPYVKHILATDVSAKMLEIAQAKANTGQVRNVTFKQTAVEDLKADADTFDAVMGHSILHLVEDRDAIIASVHRLLKPGGVFVSSTVCLGNGLKWRWLTLVAPLGRLLGLMPMVKVLSTPELVDSLTGAGFEIDHQWTPDKGLSVFIVAKKAG